MTGRFVLAGLLIAACAAPAALASPYSDFNAAIAAHNRGDWEATIKLDDAALASPDLLPSFRVPAYIDRADAHAGKQDWAGAEADYAAVLALEPDNIDARLHHAAVLHQQKKYDAAIADYVQLIHHRPKLVQAYEGRAFLYDDAGKLDAAIEDYSVVLGFEPKVAGFYVLRGSAWRRKGAFDKAIADQDHAIELDATIDRAWFERSEAYEDKGDYESAAADAAQDLRLKPDDIDARMSFGRAQWSAGDFPNAAVTFGQVVGVRPAIAYSAIWRALALAHDGKPYEQQFATDAGALDKAKWPAPLVQLYLGQSTPTAALAAASAAPDADRGNEQVCEANFYGGEWQLVHGQGDAARPMLMAAHNQCPHEFIERDAAAAELARLDKKP
jgi:lipoprotein NlpI